jgi:ribose transport system permease protein
VTTPSIDANSSVKANSSKLRTVGSVFNRLGIVVVLIVLMIVFSIISPGFFSMSNIVNILSQSSINAILAAGMTFVILTEGIDLSVGSSVALTGVVAALLFNAHVPGWLSFLAAIVVGAAAGLVNGFLTAKAKVPAIIATLGSMTFLSGIAYVLTGGYPLVVTSGFFKEIGMGSIGPIPMPVIFTAVVYVVLGFILRYTTFGRNVYMIGGNAEAARLTGIKVVSRTTWVYIISGICAALVGVILVGRLFSGQPNAGVGYELEAIAAVVLGGTSLVGGVGTIVGSLFGALFMGVLSNGLTMMNVSYYWQDIVQGLVIVLAVYLDRLRRNAANK